MLRKVMSILFWSLVGAVVSVLTVWIIKMVLDAIFNQSGVRFYFLSLFAGGTIAILFLYKASVWGRVRVFTNFGRDLVLSFVLSYFLYRTGGVLLGEWLGNKFFDGNVELHLLVGVAALIGVVVGPLLKKIGEGEPTDVPTHSDYQPPCPS